jgi:aminoglycoside phosphotransferase (APT) family kinase protein
MVDGRGVVTGTPLADVGTAVREHPAQRAWSRLSGDDRSVSRIERLQRTPGGIGAVYRLHLPGPATSIVAKRASASSVRHEAAMYGHALARLSVPSPRFFGSIEEDDASWLFVEDVGDTALDKRSDVDRRSASVWLARFHAEAGVIATDRAWPLRSTASYRNGLPATRARLRRAARADAVRAVRDGARTVLDTADALERLEASWSAVVRDADLLPSSLVHGDFVPKNVRLRPRAGAGDGATVDVLPIDWETSGFGPPAIDLAGCDDVAYAEEIGMGSAGSAVVRRAAAVGRTLRLVAAVAWAGAWLETAHPQRALHVYLPLYRAALDRVLERSEGSS